MRLTRPLWYGATQDLAMPANLLLTATDMRAGKTTVGCALAFAFKVRAMRVGVMKPVATGCRERDGVLISPDGAALSASASSNLPPELVSPYRYRAALAPIAAGRADGVPPPDFDTICRAYRTIAQQSDITIVEDTGGLTAPIEGKQNFADLAVTLGLTLMIVVASRGAFISTATLTAAYAAHRGIPVRGFILNGLDPAASTSVARDAEAVAQATGLECLGTLRYKEPLALSIVERLL
jgi:dethiobiotin synthetase